MVLTPITKSARRQTVVCMYVCWGRGHILDRGFVIRRAPVYGISGFSYDVKEGWDCSCCFFYLPICVMRSTDCLSALVEEWYRLPTYLGTLRMER